MRKYTYGKIIFTAQEMKFPFQNFFSKCDQIRKKLQIWSNFLKKSSMENFIFCAVFLYLMHLIQLVYQIVSRNAIFIGVFPKKILVLSSEQNKDFNINQLKLYFTILLSNAF